MKHTYESLIKQWLDNPPTKPDRQGYLLQAGRIPSEKDAGLWRNNSYSLSGKPRLFVPAEFRNRLYSYGFHFCLAEKVNGLVLVNNDDTTVTTKKQRHTLIWKGLKAWAISRYEVIHPYLPISGHYLPWNNQPDAVVFGYYDTQIKETYQKAGCARQRKQAYYEQIGDLVKQRNLFCQTFGISAPLPEDAHMAALMLKIAA